MVISSDNLESLTRSEDRRRHKYLKLFTAWLSLSSGKTKSGYTPICENMQLETRSLLCKKREGYVQQMAFSPVEARWQPFIDNGSEEFLMKYYLFRCAWVRQKHMHFLGDNRKYGEAGRNKTSCESIISVSQFCRGESISASLTWDQRKNSK